MQHETRLQSKHTRAPNLLARTRCLTTHQQHLVC